MREDEGTAASTEGRAVAPASSSGLSGIVIGAFEPEEAEACAGVFERAWNAGHPYAPRVIGRPEFLVAMRDRSVAVARSEGGPIVGFTGVHRRGRFIHHLYVDPSWSGRGIGRALLAHALALAGGHATLKCQVRNQRALRFYERAGWVPMEQGSAEGEVWIRLRSPAPSP
ncbi:MAG TPA: GNAT family N-acetyltransferase [Beijerinckiaceae bacterium]|jgi:GNAT superfamily N-acetyltransferase